MNNTGNRICAWRLCLCGKCPNTPRVLRVRTPNGVEMTPKNWIRAFEAKQTRVGVAA